ncbi:MAG TPA: hypothetical protein VLD39_01285 [Gammaproteobacteria bacterium]|nr:hypothetical protein [Gammaproteobacteria bacterium]
MRVNRPGEPQGAATARAPVERSTSVSVPLLRSVIEQLGDEDRRWVILDLGPARPIMLDMLSGHRVRLDIADLTDDIERAPGPAEGSRLIDLPAVRKPEPVDFVLCWDLLNYLDRKTLARLMAQVAMRCRAGALVHALIVYSERVMCRQPGQLVPTDAGTLSTPAPGGPERAAPRYSPEDFATAMPDYAVDRVRLLGNGMQEYLFKTRSLRDPLNPTASIGTASEPAPRSPKHGSTRGGRGASK